MDAIFAKHDTDRDGKVNLKEATDAIVEAFQEMTNGDEEAVQHIKGLAEKGFEDADSDKDGLITAAEFGLVHTAIKTSLTVRINPMLSVK